MTKNQELFTTLGKLVAGVNVIQADVNEIKGTPGEHSQKLDMLNSKVDSITEKVIEHDRRLTVVESDVVGVSR